MKSSRPLTSVHQDILFFRFFHFFFKKRKIPIRDVATVNSGPGLDITEHSLRDVFNDVSKYIGNISISLNAVFP
jgi:hypothetical protein